MTVANANPDSPVYLLTAARWWASLGVPVFPLHHPIDQDDDLACSCGRGPACPSPAKHPLTPNGLNDATTDLEQIDRWWHRWPQANIGLRTGVTFDLLDIDGPTGFSELEHLTSALGGEPEAIAVCESGRADGGRHYFVQPAGRKALAGGRTSPAGIDVKGDGGYVVGAPSRHISGSRYRFVDGVQYGTVTGTVPWATVYDYLTTHAPKPVAPVADPRPFTNPAPTGTTGGFGNAVLERILDEMRSAVSGHRWDTFATECAFDVARGIAGGTLDRDHAQTALREAALAAGLNTAEVDRLPGLIDNALTKVTQPIAPRTVPTPERSYTATTAVTEPWPTPTPLDLPRPPFPIDTLGPLAEHVTTIAEHFQTPLDLVAIPLIATIAATVRGRAQVTIYDGWTEPLNLYTAVLASAGETKSPALAVVTAGLRELERIAQIEAAPEIAAAEQERRIAEGRLSKAEKAAIAGKDDADHLRNEARIARDALGQLDTKVLPRYLAGDVTAEGLVRLLAEQGGVMASLTSEGGLFDTLAGGRYSSGMANLDAVLQAHDGREPILVDRKTGDPIRVEHPCLTLGLAVQPQVLAAAGKSDAAMGRGFFARFLFSYPQSRVGSRRVVDRPPLAESSAGIAGVIRRIDRRLSRSTANSFAGIAGVPYKDDFSLSSLSIDTFHAYRRVLEPRRHPVTGDLAGLGGWVAKLDGQIARLAALIQLIYLPDTPAIPAEPAVVSVEAMTAACQLGDYFTAHALAAHRLLNGQPLTTDTAAAQLLGWVQTTGLAEITVRDAFDKLRFRADFPTADVVHQAAVTLADAGYLRHVVPDKPGPGRPTARYLVNPAAMEAGA